MFFRARWRNLSDRSGRHSGKRSGADEGWRLVSGSKPLTRRMCQRPDLRWLVRRGAEGLGDRERDAWPHDVWPGRRHSQAA